MKHYLVSWTNYQNDYRSLILWAKDKDEAKALVNASYVHAANIKARELLKNKVGDDRSRPHAPQSVINNLEEALRTAKMETACFGLPGERVITSGGPLTGQSADIDTFLKDRTRLFRESWLIPEIEQALAWAKGETS